MQAAKPPCGCVMGGFDTNICGWGLIGKKVFENYFQRILKMFVSCKEKESE